MKLEAGQRVVVKETHRVLCDSIPQGRVFNIIKKAHYTGNRYWASENEGATMQDDSVVLLDGEMVEIESHDGSPCNLLYVMAGGHAVCNFSAKTVGESKRVEKTLRLSMVRSEEANLGMVFTRHNLETGECEVLK